MATTRALVLIADGQPDSQGESFDPTTIAIPDTVPVTLEFDDFKQVGSAKLTRSEDGTRIYADFTFAGPYAQVDLLARLTPASGGVAMESKVNEAGVRIYTSVAIRSVGLSLSYNCDRRIGSLAEQGCFAPVIAGAHTLACLTKFLDTSDPECPCQRRQE